MEENISGKHEANAFYIEAAVSEGGPRKLRVIPSGDEYLIYDEDTYLGNIKRDEAEWTTTKGDLGAGAAHTIGKAISRFNS